MTKQELEERLLGALAELRAASADADRYAKDWAKADHEYRHAKAIAYLASKGTVAERTAHVDKACKEEREKSHTADALRDAAKGKQRALETEISAYQTLASLMKSEMQLEGRYNS